MGELFIDFERRLKEKWRIKLECFLEYLFGKILDITATIPNESDMNKNRFKIYCCAELEGGEKKKQPSRGELTSLAAALKRFIKGAVFTFERFKGFRLFIPT